MIIRLAPDLVDEIRRVESQGGTARIKFDSTGNTNGNVIDVGGKEFKFTWSREFGDLCDIYEERQSGEDGNGLLVESGCAWRKVNVQRMLDESTKNHFKMRSEEAERKHKSRKAIVLDHGNPSMKSQIKQLAAAESNPWRMFKQKKESPFKKRKVEPTIVPKSNLKPGVPSTASAKGRRSSSPLPSTPEQSGTPASPFGTGNVTKNNVSTDDVAPMQIKSKENASNTEKELQTRAPSAVRETPGPKGNFGTKPTDLQSMLITLLSENPKGMSLKALEKAIGDKIPNSFKKIEPIIKKIAIFQAPGRYLLKPGVELESFKKPSSESGSSPEENLQHTLVREDNRDHKPAPGSRFAEKSHAVGFEEHGQSNSKFEEESNALEKVEIQQHSPDLFGEKKVSDNSEGQAGSSSDSGSDSDSESDSSDSGSDSGSRSRSRSRSPVGSGSGSSSDSESDASSNSKQGSDEDVDILSDDDKELQAPEPGLSASPEPWRSGPNRTDENQDGDGSDAVDIDGTGSAAIDIEVHESDAVDIEKDLADEDKELELAANDSSVPIKEDEKPVEGQKSIFFDNDAIQERQTFIGTLFEDNENMVRDSFRHEQSDSSERIPKTNSKRAPEMKHFDDKSELAKRLRVESLAQVPISESRDSHLSESPPNRDIEDTYRSPAMQTMSRADREGNADFGSQKACNQAFLGKPISDFQQPGRGTSDKIALSKASETGRAKQTESLGHGRKFSEKNSYVHDGFPIQREKASRDTQNEDSFAKEKKVPKKPKGGGAGGRHSAPFDSHYRKQSETFGKFKDAGQVTNSHTGPSLKDNNRVDIEKYHTVSGRSLQRELSELELGEFREPLLEETPIKKQFERKGSFKQSENKPSTSDNCNSDLSKAKPVEKTSLDSGKPSPSILGAGIKRTPDHNIEDLARSHHNIVKSHPPHLSRVENSEVGSHFSKLAETNSRLRQNEPGAKLGNSMESYGESNRRALANSQQLHDSKRGPYSLKESKTQVANTMVDLVDGQKDAIFTEVNNNALKRRESSSEEDGSSYSKYEKDVPELKGPIKDISQYKEYVQEYRDKYDSYCSLNKVLENYRSDFLKLGKDLEFAKGRDMDRYQKILVQLKESYHQCGAKHKRLKGIFIILHEELKNLKQQIKEFALSCTKD
ncbi:hypothetical protein JCGZ_24803 [Jatropha curcas]|uniref:OCEL domain-containing protein n=2 Tax=Jatropha curcas TaxID=180498 RepID=A0A067L9N8_JATCU|nr:hypothetical protein JCGZ_24803 [Jatropha curcas]